MAADWDWEDASRRGEARAARSFITALTGSVPGVFGARCGYAPDVAAEAGGDAAALGAAGLYVGWFLPAGASPETRTAYCQAAALFLLHPRHTPEAVSAGAVAGRLLGRPGFFSHAAFERGFGALLAADASARGPALAWLFGGFRRLGAPVNYQRLLLDLLRWSDPAGSVQAAWRRDCFGAAQ